MIMRQFTRQQLSDVESDGDARQIDGWRVQDPAHRDGHVLLADICFFEDELEQPGPSFFC